ncbi:hypothetical protein BSZ22_31110 [Bradyrhizobium canariense]|nr:hypothetical protein BSZ22_31110 [Bradyrhizobium canariense]OSI75849.1 hypothetical protein BSZ23_27530 [Bradyrhizobium canariense]
MTSLILVNELTRERVMRSEGNENARQFQSSVHVNRPSSTQQILHEASMMRHLEAPHVGRMC